MTTGRNMIKGRFTEEWVLIEDMFCSECSGTLEGRLWESDCGGFEDHQYRCTRCGHIYWVDGPDA